MLTKLIFTSFIRYVPEKMSIMLLIMFTININQWYVKCLRECFFLLLWFRRTVMSRVSLTQPTLLMGPKSEYHARIKSSYGKYNE